MQINPKVYEKLIKEETGLMEDRIIITISKCFQIIPRCFYVSIWLIIFQRSIRFSLNVRLQTWHVRTFAAVLSYFLNHCLVTTYFYLQLPIRLWFEWLNLVMPFNTKSKSRCLTRAKGYQWTIQISIFSLTKPEMKIQHFLFIQYFKKHKRLR